MQTLRQELEEFSKSNNNLRKLLIVIGDSFSWGTGMAEFTEESVPYDYLLLEDYEIWPYHMKHNYGGYIAQELGFDYVNYSVPGCSNDTIYRNFMYLLENHSDWLDRAFVLIGWTANHRYEIPSPGILRSYRNMAPTWEKNIYRHTKWVCEYHELYNQHIHCSKADDIRSYNHLVSVTNILENNKIKNLQYWAIKQFQEDFDIKGRCTKFKNISHNINLSSICVHNIPAENMLPCKHPDSIGHKIISDQILNVRY